MVVGAPRKVPEVLMESLGKIIEGPCGSLGDL